MTKQRNITILFDSCCRLFGSKRLAYNGRISIWKKTPQNTNISLMISNRLIFLTHLILPYIRQMIHARRPKQLVLFLDHAPRILPGLQNNGIVVGIAIMYRPTRWKVRYCLPHSEYWPPYTGFWVIRTSENIHANPTVKLDPINVGLDVGIWLPLAILQTEIYI